MLNEVKHLAIACEILRCAQNNTLCFKIVSYFYDKQNVVN
jgi:hypothetical protein